MDGSQHILSGAPEGFDARLLLRELKKSEVLLHIVRDDRALEAMRQSLAFFAPDIPVLSFPAWDCLPYDRISPNPEISAARLSTLAFLSHADLRGIIILTTINAATQLLPPASVLREASISLVLNDRLDLDALRAKLVRMGFAQAPSVSEAGDFAVRGGIVDIYPPGQSGPVRLDLFGDNLDGIRRFDPVSQRSKDLLKRIEIVPVSEILLDEAAIERFRGRYREAFGAAGRDDALYEAVSAGRKHAGMEHWLPFFHPKLEGLLEYIPDASITMDDSVKPAHRARWEAIEDHYEARRLAMADRSAMESVYKPVPPHALYQSEENWERSLAGRRVIQFEALPKPTGPGVLDAGGRIGRNFSPERKLEDINLFSALAEHIRAHWEKKPVVICSYSAGARERLQGLLSDEGIHGAELIKEASDIGKSGLHLAIWPLEHGFEAEDMLVISEQDVLGDRLIRKPKRRRKAENFLSEVQSLNLGDLVVHVEHGIGRYQGLEVVEAAGSRHECLALEYAEGAKLYLPVENIELLSRYGHEEGLLDKLGGGAWQARKARLKQRIKDMAERLIRVAAERTLRAAPIMEPPGDLWENFSARFPYQETEDQLRAIEEVVEDLARGHPMDRLICGDVGFGKTEVALRAAFIAAASGKQVAVIAPTTLLARQHLASFKERFRGFPLSVRGLSRFTPAKEAEATRKAINDGQVDIVIGTHALLAKSVRFANLGLLIVDEEQHFGVAHKERLKSLKSDIHVLTLTATPIPRTLQLSLSGVRDLSIIATPPVDRLAIRTYVSEFDGVTIREALLRERYRGGQSFFVVPRISDIPEIEEFLGEQLPELSFITAHGQMAAGELDKRMNAFYDGKYDVLLATTIIESGIDIPSANTLIVWRADMFGLAQLYQIRGRVGRAKLRAYAYLTTRPRIRVTDHAQRRLRVLGAMDSLGAGFSLASQDLDLRGAGNLVGEEQSGQMRDVGFELYQHMLEETIAKIRSGELTGPQDIEDTEFSPQINLGVSVLIPEEYVPDLDLRLGLYRRLSGLSTKVEMEGFAAELIDRFGPVPREVSTLIAVMRIKAMCRRAGVARLDGGPKGATIQFHNDKFASPQGLVAFLENQKGLAKVRDNKIVIRRDWAKENDRIKGAFSVVRELAEHAQKAKKKAK